MSTSTTLRIDQQRQPGSERQARLEHIPGLVELDEEIEKLALLDEDWNEEGAPPIDKSSIIQAHVFLSLLACESAESMGDWDLPSVYPNVDGGVQLYWNKPDEQVSLCFRPSEGGIDYLVKKQGEPALRTLVSNKEALAEALRAIQIA